MKRLLGLVILALVGLLVGVPNALAGDTTCNGALSGVHDNVVVPENVVCTMMDAQVKGNVKVQSGGGLSVRTPTTIWGNIDAEPGHKFVRLFFGGVVVKGNVQIKGQAAGFGSAGFQPGTTIHGNFSWEENAGPLVASNGTVKGNLKMEKNTGGGSITGNTISGNLECKENNHPPTVSNNTVGGNTVLQLQ